MGTPQIFLEHKKGSRVHRVLRVKPGRELFVIGSSQNADLRINGDGVKGCHAALRFRAPHWYLCDLSGTLPQTETIVDGKGVVEIAGNRIQLFTKERDTELFREEDAQKGILAHHQVIVRSRKGRVL